MTKKNKEYEEQLETRPFHGELQTVSVRGEGPMILEGWAAKYGKHTWFRGYPEVIRKGAFTESLRAVAEGKRTVYALYHHDIQKPLGRTDNDTLVLEDRDEGLWMRMSLPDTTYARDVYNMVDSGHCRGASFGMVERLNDFDIVKGIRELRNLTLKEVTVTPMPIYGDTSVSARAIDEFAEIEKQKQEFEQYQKDTQDRLNKYLAQRGVEHGK